MLRDKTNVLFFLRDNKKNLLCANASDLEILTFAKDWFRFTNDQGKKSRVEGKRLPALQKQTDNEQDRRERRSIQLKIKFKFFYNSL